MGKGVRLLRFGAYASGIFAGIGVFGAGAIAIALILAGVRAVFDVRVPTWIDVVLVMLLLALAGVVGRRTARATVDENVGRLG